MANPKLTVAMPVKDGENYIRETMDCILGQDFGDFNVVIAENASTDATNEILADYARRDRRVTVYSEPKPIGHTPNFNRAVDLCDTPWVKLICHDDLLRRDALTQISQAIDAAEENGVGLISTGFRHMFDDSVISPGKSGNARQFYEGRDAVRRYLSKENAPLVPAISNSAMRRDVFYKAGGFDNRFLHQDLPCWLYLLVHANLFYLPDTLTVIRVHPGQITNFSNKSGHSIFDFRTFLNEYIAKYGDQIGIDRETRLRARFRSISVAARLTNDLLSAGKRTDALRLLASLPPYWLPLVPFAQLRMWRKEGTRNAAMEASLYPFDAATEGIPVA